MAVSINQTQKFKDDNESDIDKIAKLLNIGVSGYGIYDAMGRRALANEQAAREKTVFDQQQEYTAKMKDVNSPLYKAAQSAYQQAGVKVDPNVSMYDAKQLYGDAGDLLKAKLSAQQKQDGLTGLLAQERLDKMMREKNDELFKKSPEGKMQNLNASDKARFDNVIMALGAINGMAKGLNQGDFTMRPGFTGDNDFTLSAKQWEEAIGRMQSGGAIGVEEAKRFRGLAPGGLDSQDIRSRKLTDAQNLMIQRFKTLGFDPTQAEKLGLDPSLFAGVDLKKQEAPFKMVNGAKVYNVPQANAATAPAPHPQDNEAVQWAKQNPNDPAARKILQLNGVK